MSARRTPERPRGGGVAATRPEGRRGGRERLPRGFGPIWATVALDLIGFGIVIPILPLYARRFGASPLQVGLLGASFSLAQFVCAPLWGRVSDRIGRRPVLLASLAGTALASLVCGLAGSLWVLLLARAVDGASGASVPVAQAAVADLAPPQQRTRLLGLVGAAFGLGFVVGPALGGLAAVVARHLRPHDPLAPGRAAFLLTAVLAAANGVAAWRRVPETRAAASAATADANGLGGVGDAGESSDGPGARGARGALGRLLPVTFASVAAFAAFEYTFSLFGEGRLGLREGAMSVVFVVVGLLISVVQGGLVARVSRRLGVDRALALGLVSTGAGLAVLPLVHHWWALAAPLVLLCAGQGIASPSLTAAAVARVDARRRGAALGVQQSASALGRIVGPLAGGWSFQRIGIAWPYLGGGAVFVCCAAAVASMVMSRGAVPSAG